MNLIGNTILITGGTSGIGLELANQLQQRGNDIIICSRSREKLESARAENAALVTYRCDVSNPDDCKKMVSWLEAHKPALNVLINNAAVSHTMDFIEDDAALEKASIEIETNLTAPIRLIKQLYPMLSRNAAPKIINITTGLIYAPRSIYPIYNATKSALHSFTQVLRIQVEKSPAQVIEVQLPAVDTPWHGGNPPKIAIPVEVAVKEMMSGLEKGREEIKVGKVKLLYILSRIVPGYALRKVNSL
ncbi:MAG: SDR family oxidoreductase [Rhodothermales bacterium]